MAMTALILLGSLKDPKESRTNVLSEMLVSELKKHGVRSKIAYLSQSHIHPGVHEVSPEWEDAEQCIGDAMGDLYDEILLADILVFATPIWWNDVSSHIQKIFERMTAFDDFYIREGRSPLYGKVSGVLVSGTDDGAQSCMARCLLFANQLGYTLPPEAFATWMGPEDAEFDEIRKNEDTRSMVEVMARNLALWAGPTATLGEKAQKREIKKAGQVAK